MSEVGEISMGGRVGHVEIHASSAFGRNPKAREKEISSTQKAFENAQKLNPLEKYRLDLTETVFKEPFESIKNNLRKTYSVAGLEIKEEDFPSVAIYDTGEKRVVKACGGFGAGRAGFGNRVDLFPVGEGNLLLDIRMLHHETNHHLGRQVVVSRMTEKKLLGFKWKDPETSTTQLGLASYLRENDERGLMLEEGVVEYFATDFVLTSDDELIVKARENYVKDTGANVEGLDNYAIRWLCKKELEKHSLPRYATARLLIETLIEGARKIGEDEAVEMRKDILKTRIDTKNTRILMDRVDKIFGAGTFSKAYYLKFNGDKTNEEENKLFVVSLREKVGLS
ncbi:MAG TPA: hypothetical protein VI795_02400 [Patescibacteria group bacterium]|nr:hypothetical protein [Patescibacteria group bacterium]